jgi:hypothetical protein
MAITDEVLNELLKDYQKPEDLLGKNGLLKQLQKRRVASASVRDGISAAAVVFAPDYGSEDDHQIRPHLFSRDCAGSTSPDSLAPAA